MLIFWIYVQQKGTKTSEGWRWLQTTLWRRLVARCLELPGPLGARLYVPVSRPNLNLIIYKSNTGKESYTLSWTMLRLLFLLFLAINNKWTKPKPNGVWSLHYFWWSAFLKRNHPKQIFTADLCHSSVSARAHKLFSHHQDGVTGQGSEGSPAAPSQCGNKKKKLFRPDPLSASRGESPAPRYYCSTWPRVSGSLRARKLPAANAPEAKRMGTALVMPTNEVKMLIPKTAASLQSALRKPNAVVLGINGEERVGVKSLSCTLRSQIRQKLLNLYSNYNKH